MKRKKANTKAAKKKKTLPKPRNPMARTLKRAFQTQGRAGGRQGRDLSPPAKTRQTDPVR
jgi:hypothetical protein